MTGHKGKEYSSIYKEKTEKLELSGYFHWSGRNGYTLLITKSC